MIALDDLSSSLIPATGQLGFSVPLAALPDPVGPGFALIADYGSPSDALVTGPVLSEPTGILGLGWSLRSPRIEMMVAPGGSLARPRYRLVGYGATTPLLRLGEEAGGAHLYGAQSGEFWIVRHFPAADLWEVTDEGGVVYRYGAADGEDTAVETIVAWDSWCGASLRSRGEASVAVAWRLAQVRDRSGATLSLRYLQDQGTVGASRAVFTRAAYLAEVTGAQGGSLALTYGDKDPSEYQLAHTLPAAPNAWQDSCETRYLERVDVRAPGSAMLESILLDYALMGSAPAVKRLLTGIRGMPPAGRPAPGAVFSYQTGGSDSDYGRLTRIVVPEGGVAEASWSRVEPALSERSVAVAAPGAGGGAFGAPALAFGDDFVVALFTASDLSTAAARVYTWEGRWVAADPVASTPLASAGVARVSASESSFAVQIGAAFQPFTRDPRTGGAWVGASAPVPLTLAAGEASLLACSGEAAAMLGLAGLQLAAATFDGSAWVAQPVQTLSGAASDPVASLAGGHGVIAAAITDAGAAQSGVTLHLFTLDPDRRWAGSSVTLPRPSALVDGILVQLQATFAVVRSTGLSGTLRSVAFDLIDFSRPLAPRVVRLTRMLVGSHGQIPTAALFPDGVTIGQQLWRYDGLTWNPADVSGSKPAGAGPLLSLSVGADVVARSFAGASGGTVFDLVTFDPNATAPAPAWPTALSAAVSGGSFAARAARTPRGDPGFVLFPRQAGQAGLTAPANSVWRRQPGGSWERRFDVPDSIAQADLPALQIVEGRYLVYQCAAGAVAYALDSSGVVAASRTLIAGARLLVPDMAPDALLPGSCFATYSGTWGPAARISLHRVTGTGADGPAAVPVLARLRILAGAVVDEASGYPVVDQTPTYETASAVGDPEGRAGVFNRVAIATTSPFGGQAGSVQIEFFNGLTASESAALPAATRPAYPEDPVSNASSYARLMTGKPYRTTISYQDASAVARSDFDADYWTVVERTFALSGQGAGSPTGFYARVRRSDSRRDGVAATVSTTYNSNGLPAVAASSRLTGSGALEAVSVAYRYFPEHYPGDAENLLLPVVQTTTTVDDVVTASEVETWATWESGATFWAPKSRAIATAADAAPFTAWDGGTLPSGWRMVETVTARNAFGAPIAVSGPDSDGLDQYDAAGARIVARFAGAAPGEASFLGFEPYEASLDWSYLGASIEAQITTAQFHTGTRSLRIDPSSQSQPAGPAAVFLDATADRRFLFSCWMQTQPGFVADPLQARWTLQVSVVATGQPVGAPVAIAFPATAGAWVYVSAVLDLGAIRAAGGIAAGTPLSVTILGSDSRQSSSAAYADELRFSPLDCVYSAQVFDLSAGRTSALLGENGQTTRIVRNGSGAIAAVVGPADLNVGMIAAAAYSREMAGDSFNPAFPNQILRCLSSSLGIYQDFDPSDLAGWTLPSGWAIANKALTFSGQSSDPIGSRAELTGFLHSDYAARVRAPAESCQASSVSIGTGDLFVSWLPGVTAGQGTWSLRSSAGSGLQVLAETAGEFRENWLFAIVDGVAFFFADGRQIFGVIPTAIPQGRLQLAASGPAAFEQLVVAVDPSLSISFTDGAGQPLLDMAMVDRQTVTVEGVLYDSMGRVSVHSNPVSDPIALAAPGASPPATAPTLALGAPTTYLPLKTTGGRMSLQEYLTPSLSGAPYSQSLFEASPYGRPIETGAPGPLHAIGSGHTVRTAYLANAAGDWMTQVIADPAAPGRAAGSYAITRVTDPNGAVVETATNAAGQVIARALKASATGAPTAIESYLYDSGGRQIEARTPNHYSPPPGSDAATWKRTASFDFLGRLTAVSAPDSGQELYLSDSNGQPRFGLSAADAALVPPRIRYVRRDRLGRVVERGTVAQAGLGWSGVAVHADDRSWPTAADGASWTHRYTYDRPAGAGPNDPQPANLVGQLASLSINSTGLAEPGAGSLETYAYAYDLGGRVIAQDSAVPAYDSSVRRSGFDWDNQSRLIGITYPRKLDPQSGQPQGDPVTVSYFYDRLGRLAGVGNAPEGTEVLDPSNANPGPKVRYAEYGYDSAGLPASTTYGRNSGGPLSLAFTFDVAGRPTVAGGDYVQQSFTYDGGGLGGATDLAGRVLAMRTLYRSRDGTDPASIVSDRTWQYRYDPAGRLTGAAASDSGSDSSLIAGMADSPITYDADGVMLTVPRGPVTETYGLVADGETGRTASAVRRIVAAAAQNVDFSGAALPPGWSSGASNQGPSSSAIVATGDPDSPFFRLDGGGPGHRESLTFTAALGEQGSYTLAVRWKSADPFAAEAGAAGCALLLNTAEGVGFRKPVADFSAGSASWRTDTIVLDVAAAVAEAALAGKVTSVTVELFNGKRGADGQSGAALRIKSILLGGTTPQIAQNQYDASGRMIAAPLRAIAGIDYNPVTGQPGAIRFAPGGPVKSAAWRRGPGGSPVLHSTTYFDDSVARTLQIRAPGGALLATETMAADGSTRAELYLRDTSRVFGTVPAGSEPATYRLFDSLGSLRAVAAEGDGGDAGLRARFDYGPFGEPIVSTDETAGPAFAGHSSASPGGLFDMKARFYDAKLRTFLAPDAAMATSWSYGYAAGDPVNMVDPSGDIPQWGADALRDLGGEVQRTFYSQPLRRHFWAASMIWQAWSWYGYYDSAMQNAGMMADVAEVATAALLGSGARYYFNARISSVQSQVRGLIHPRFSTAVPAMSFLLDVSSEVYWAGTYGAVRTSSAYFVRRTLPEFSFAGWIYGTGAHAVAVLPGAAMRSVYRHLFAPAIWFPGWQRGRWAPVRGVASRNFMGPMRVDRVLAGNSYFLLAEGTYAFEELAVESAYVFWFMQRGNTDMNYDTTLSLDALQPSAFAAGLSYGAMGGFVLEHRMQLGWTLIMRHIHHTPGWGGRGRGGPGHVGISHVIKHWARIPWWLSTVLPWGADMLVLSRRLNLTELTGNGPPPAD